MLWSFEGNDKVVMYGDFEGEGSQFKQWPSIHNTKISLLICNKPNMNSTTHEKCGISNSCTICIDINISYHTKQKNIKYNLQKCRQQQHIETTHTILIKYLCHEILFL